MLTTIISAIVKALTLGAFNFADGQIVRRDTAPEWTGCAWKLSSHLAPDAAVYVISVAAELTAATTAQNCATTRANMRRASRASSMRASSTSSAAPDARARCRA